MGQTATLDLNPEPTSQRLDHMIEDARAWTAATVDPQSCILRFEDDSLAEIRAMAEQMRRHPLPTLLRALDHFDIPALRALMARAKAMLDGGLGVAVVETLPLDDIAVEAATAVFWVLGQAIGRPVAQRWDGTMLYDVRDTGRAFGYGVRGSITSVELVFHTDNAFAIAPPDAVGLLCLRPAVEGGLSRFCSLYTVHNRMLRDHPAQLERLYRPLLWDRQAEHAPGAETVTAAPMFHFDGARLSVRANVSLVRKGYALAGVDMDAATAEALDALEQVVADPGLWFALPVERGQLQYLNNREVAHYRSQFRDHDDPALRRHLIRTWHRDSGAPSYDG